LKPVVPSTLLGIQRSNAMRLRLRLAAGRPRLSTGKRLPSGGRLVAFVGGDGAGKSTQVRRLEQATAPHLTTIAVHMGRPRPRTSGRVLRAVGAAASAVDAEAGTALAHLGLAIDRRAAYRRALRVRSMGGLAVLDRLPHPGLRTMDGPRIAASSGLAGRLARMERSLYSQMREADHIVVLTGTVEAAMARRPHDDVAMLNARWADILLTSWDRDYMTVLDTSRAPVEETAQGVLAAVWDVMFSPLVATEVTGVSGVGKSSLVDALKDQLPMCRTSLPYRSHPLLLVTSALMEGRVAVRSLFLRSRASHVARNLVQLRWFELSMRRGRLERHRLTSNFVIDQGPVFQLALATSIGHVAADSPRFSRLAQSIEQWYASGTVVLEASDDTIERRIKARNRSGPGAADGLHGAELTRFLGDFRMALHSVTARLSTEVLSSESADPVELAVACLSRFRR
jgi:thymidylate kinase